jgi:glycosyltransferase involved in cell wall biosynthesis
VSTAPAISVLLPVRDAGRHLDAAVRDVLAQRDVDLELVAVDDGSRDASGERLEAFARSDSRLQLIRTGGVGAARALDLALAAAHAPLVAQMEADDRCPPDRLARLAAALRARPEWQGMTSRASTFGFPSEGMRRYIAWQNGLAAPEAMARARFVEIPALHQTGLYRRASLDAIGGFLGATEAGGWPLDIDFWMRWYEHGLIAGKVPRVLYRWRQHPRQSTRTRPSHVLNALRRCKAHYFARGPGRGRAIDVLSVGATLAGWCEALRAAGCNDVQQIAWRPATPLPATRAGAIRLFVYGTAPARARVIARIGALDADRDWFAA